MPKIKLAVVKIESKTELKNNERKRITTASSHAPFELVS